MSAIIKAVGVKFNNPSLPILAPMITQGLEAAWRPNNSSMGLIDLSGNGHTLTKAGNPELTETTILVNNTNGFVTDVRETLDLTYFVVHRAHKDASESNVARSWEGFPVGCFYDNRGTSIFCDYYNGQAQINAQCFGKKTNGAEMQSRLWWLRRSPIQGNTTNWTVSAFVVKASDNQMFGYQPQLQSTPVQTYDATPDGYRLDLRHLSDPVTRQPNYIKLGIANVFFGSAKSEIAEVLIYNRALSQDEIMRQYQYSKEFMLKHRNIVI